MMIRFTNQERAGMLPDMLDLLDPRSARQQLDSSYQHGGGWRPFPGFELKYPKVIKLDDLSGVYLDYPGDPPTLAVSAAALRDELIILFQHDWVAILQSNGEYEIARMD